jgi:dihydropteroate synthase
MRLASLELRGTVLDWRRVYVAGVVNVTPDSFSDGGRYLEPEVAVALAAALVDAGADLLDVGGESTRPGARPVEAEEEIERVVPVILALAARGATPIAVDTTKAAVGEAALAAGAEIVNDVSGGRIDPELAEVADAAGAAYVCGHARGRSLDEIHAAERTPPTFDEVVAELRAQVAALPERLRARTIVDPGLGFGKRTPHNLELIRRAGELAAAVGRPVMVGPSRKRFIGELTGRPVGDRDGGTIGAALAAAAAGAHIVRVHDVAGVRSALTVFEAVRAAGTAPA